MLIIKAIVGKEFVSMGGIAIRLLRNMCSSSTHSFSQLLENLDRGIPIDTGVSDTDTFFQSLGAFCRDFLVAFIDVGLDHHADDGGLAFAELVADDLSDFGLVAVVFVGIAWRGISKLSVNRQFTYHVSNQSSRPPSGPSSSAFLVRL